MIENTFEKIPIEKFSEVIVVTQYDAVITLAKKYCFKYIINYRPDLGISRSVMLGTQALKDKCDGIIYMVSDQPWLKKKSISKMTDVFALNPNKIISMSNNGVRGNPCIFPSAYFEELCNLSGDKGGSTVIKLHEDKLLLFEVQKSELIDVDTPETINQCGV